MDTYTICAGKRTSPPHPAALAIRALFSKKHTSSDNIEREKISAKVENGVMTIDIPKKKVEELAAATRQIEVK